LRMRNGLNEKEKEMMLICANPYCKKEFDPSGTGKYKYCSERCSRIAFTIPKGTKTCANPNCKKTFSPVEARRGTSKFCSVQCRKEAHEMRIEARKKTEKCLKKVPSKPEETRICANSECGKEFIAKVSKQKFCSLSCSNFVGNRYQPKQQKECANPDCKKLFLGNGRDRYCSIACSFKMREKRRIATKQYVEHTCPVCGKKFSYVGTHQFKYCSSECRKKTEIKVATCKNPDCRKVFTVTRERKLYCSEECQNAMFRKTYCREHPIKICENPQCKKEFVSKSVDNRFCSRECLYIATRKEKKEEKLCAKCGKPFFTSYKRMKYCSKECSSRKKQKIERECLNCEKTFITSNNKLFCSDDCKFSYYRPRKTKQEKREVKTELSQHDGMEKNYDDWLRVDGVLKKVKIGNKIFSVEEPIKDNPKHVKEMPQIVLDFQQEEPRKGKRQCTRCGATKSFGYFYKLKNGNPTSMCKTCKRKEYERKKLQKLNTIIPSNIYIKDEQTDKPDIGIVDATGPDALPLTDSGSVVKNEVDKKVKNWNKFRKS
jgi:hypothetical protein